MGSAIGFLRAPVAYEVVRSLYQRFSTFDVNAVNVLLTEMEMEAAQRYCDLADAMDTHNNREAAELFINKWH